MDMAKIDPKKIEGKWRSGIALDIHTLSSTHVGVNEYGRDIFDTQYSELGNLLHRLKYKADKAAAAEIIKTAVEFLKPHRDKFDIIIPVPPSTQRAMQPVTVMANGIGGALGLPVVDCIRTTRETTQLKGVKDPEKRRELLAGLYEVDAAKTTGKNVLLFDDLFRSGSTLNAITDVLMGAGKAATVRAFAITRTRSNR